MIDFFSTIKKICVTFGKPQMENDFLSQDDSLKIDLMFDQNVYIRSSLLSKILSKLGHSSYSLSQACMTIIISFFFPLI